MQAVSDAEASTATRRVAVARDNTPNSNLRRHRDSCILGSDQPRFVRREYRLNSGKRAGGHVFQLNFSNNIGTTPSQIARGGFDNEDWYIGFNISRKFF